MKTCRPRIPATLLAQVSSRLGPNYRHLSETQRVIHVLTGFAHGIAPEPLPQTEPEPEETTDFPICLD